MSNPGRLRSYVQRMRARGEMCARSTPDGVLTMTVPAMRRYAAAVTGHFIGVSSTPLPSAECRAEQGQSRRFGFERQHVVAVTRAVEQGIEVRPFDLDRLSHAIIDR